LLSFAKSESPSPFPLVTYTNPTKTAAVVEAEIWQGEFEAHVGADTATDGGPLASLNWRVVDGVKTAWQIAGQK
jgi:hypothetical protein